MLAANAASMLRLPSRYFVRASAPCVRVRQCKHVCLIRTLAQDLALPSQPRFTFRALTYTCVYLGEFARNQKWYQTHSNFPSKFLLLCSH